MKRRNAESGKMRRPLKRTKITEGMSGNSILYLKFVLIWAVVVMADYLLEFRFEFLWPFWMMLRSVYDSFKYQGLAFSIFFICIALTSDLICFFFIPLQYIFFAASTYVWVHYVWFTFADKGICLPTVALCCLVVYAEGALRGARGGPLELWRPLAAHCVGYPVLSLGFGVKAYVGRRLRLRRQRQVRAENEFYFQLMRDALPESALVDQNQSKEEGEQCANGSARADHDGLCEQHAQLHVKLEKLEKHLAQQTLSRDRDKLVAAFAADKAAQAAASASASASASSSTSASANTSSATNSSVSTHAFSNGAASGAGADEHDSRHDHSSKGSARPSRCEKREAISIREEKRKHKNKDKDKDKEKDSSDSHSHKSAEHIKEQVFKEKEVESTKENTKSHKENNNHKEKERERDREREREREAKEKEKEREKEREREQRLARECSEELKRTRAELAAARAGEAEARRALAAAAAAERQRRADHAQLRQAHAQLQHKVTAWRTGERATLERRLSEERRARTAAEHQLRAARSATKTPSGECESEQCVARARAADTEAGALRRDLQRARERAAQLQRDLHHATEQVRALETRQEEAAQAAAAAAAAASSTPPASSSRLAGALQALQERAAHLERSLSAETRVKLDLLSALGDAKRHMHIQEGLISRQEKELEELKAQMLAVMPSEYMTPVGGGVSKLRLSDGSPLDPNASVYTPKQLCSDA